MSTRCFIGIELESGGMLSIYCHHDGYPEGVGEKLQMYWDDRQAVEELLRLGDISSLGLSIEGTEAYCRDRGEPLHPARIRSEEAMLESWGEYVYMYTLLGVWMVKSLGREEHKWHSINAAIDSPEILDD